MVTMQVLVLPVPVAATEAFSSMLRKPLGGIASDVDALAEQTILSVPRFVDLTVIVIVNVSVPVVGAIAGASASSTGR